MKIIIQNKKVNYIKEQKRFIEQAKIKKMIY